MKTPTKSLPKPAQSPEMHAMNSNPTEAGKPEMYAIKDKEARPDNPGEQCQHPMPKKTKKCNSRNVQARSSLARGSDFQRELRYLVVKIKDANRYLTETERDILGRLVSKCGAGRIDDERGLLHCVVVESDWPEYDPTWNAIEKRMTQRPHSLIGGNWDTEKAHAAAGYPDNR